MYRHQNKPEIATAGFSRPQSAVRKYGIETPDGSTGRARPERKRRQLAHVGEEKAHVHASSMNLLRMQARRRGNGWPTKRVSALFGGCNSALLKAVQSRDWGKQRAAGPPIMFANCKKNGDDEAMSRDQKKEIAREPWEYNTPHDLAIRAANWAMKEDPLCVAAHQRRMAAKEELGATPHGMRYRKPALPLRQPWQYVSINLDGRASAPSPTWRKKSSYCLQMTRGG